MSDLTAVIGSKELPVDCGQCNWQDARCLDWLLVHRDMICPGCGGVIVLNTSERRRQMAALQRQVRALHEQLVETLSSTLLPAAYEVRKRHRE
jgi:hypothetical protein